MWTQIVGKVCLALMPPANHFWNIAFHFDGQGLTTPLMPYQDRAFSVRFNFIEDQLEILCSDGGVRLIHLEPMTVTEFYKRFRQELQLMDIEVKIWPVPVEFANSIPFALDTTHHEYEAEQAHAFFQALLSMKPVFDDFRCEFVGKCSPVHFFWGSFDLAVSRFSGRRAPSKPEMGAMYAEAYSHEVISHGFWPGGSGLNEAAFYGYCVPAPDGFSSSNVAPAAAYWHEELSEFVLPYEAVRSSATPEADLKAFLESTYNAAADLASWDRIALER